MSEVLTTPVRHPLYYFPSSTHVFQVDNTLYRLCSSTLAMHSQAFSDMFSTPKISGCEEQDGRSDEKPIRLNGVSSRMFELFLEHTFGRMGAGLYTLDELSSILHFCDMYQCTFTRNYVISRIKSSRFRFHPAQVINVAIKCHVRELFPDAFKQLVDMPVTDLAAPQWELLGSTVFTHLVYVKAALDQHHRIVAAEPPKILVHASECQDPLGCEEDWHTIWWVGMGRFLLDGRNPQPYREAVKRFKGL